MAVCQRVRPSYAPGTRPVPPSDPNRSRVPVPEPLFEEGDGACSARLRFSTDPRPDPRALMRNALRSAPRGPWARNAPCQCRQSQTRLCLLRQTGLRCTDSVSQGTHRARLHATLCIALVMLQRGGGTGVCSWGGGGFCAGGGLEFGEVRGSGGGVEVGGGGYSLDWDLESDLRAHRPPGGCSMALGTGPLGRRQGHTHMNEATRTQCGRCSSRLWGQTVLEERAHLIPFGIAWRRTALMSTDTSPAGTPLVYT